MSQVSPGDKADPLRWHLANIGLLAGIAIVGFVFGGLLGGIASACAALAWMLLVVRDRRFPNFLPSDRRRDSRAVVMFFGFLGTLTAVAFAVGAIRGR